MNITSSIWRMVLMNRGMLLHSLYKLQKHKLHTDIHMRCCIKEWVYFFWVHGVWIVARKKQIAWTAKRFSCDLFVPRYDSYPMNPEKRHSFLIFTMFPTRTLSKILREKLFIHNSHSNGHFTSIDVLITAHVIRPNRRTFCWLFIGNWTEKFYQGSTKEIWYHCKYLLMNRGKETIPFAAVCYGVYCFHSKTTLIMWLALQPQHTKVSHWKAIVPLVLICYWYIAFKVTLLYPLDLHY